MSPETHSEIAGFIWNICNLLRGPYKRNEYRKVILPLTVLRRFDCILDSTKQQVLEKHNQLKDKSENIIRPTLCDITESEFYNLSKMDFQRLLDDPNHLAPNLNSYINAFSPNVRHIMERFDFGQHILRMDEKNLLFEVVKAFSKVDLSPQRIDNIQMGYIFEELIRVGAEQSNEEAGEHFTPREVIKLMVNLLLSDETDLAKSHIVKTIYDPACGTGGMLSTSEEYIRKLNSDANPVLYGQDLNDEAYAICKSDMLIKGEDSEKIRLGDSFTQDAFPKENFDYMLANPPFGVSWKQQERFISREKDTLGYNGRFGAGTPRINDGSLLFLQHMISKMRSPENGGSRIAIVFNGSPMFTGDAGSGESEIRRWIIENDWLEAVVALPDQLFYNTGISTYIWILTNRKTNERKGKVQLLDARSFSMKMRKSLGNKRNEIGDGEDGKPDQIDEISKIYGRFSNEQYSKIFDNENFGFNKITVERPLRLNFQVSPERVLLLDDQSTFRNLASSKKKDISVRDLEMESGRERQKQIKDVLGKSDPDKLYKDRKVFIDDLKKLDKKNELHLSAPEFKAVVDALGERDETAEICRDSKGKPEPDSELRDTESVPLKESIEEYFKREVLPHVPDAWIDCSKTKVGYEIPLTRHFYVYQPPRPLEDIDRDIKELEAEILNLLQGVSK